MYKFIYAISREASDLLVAQGFRLIKEDKNNNIYIFENDEKKSFNFSTGNFAFSDILTF